MKPRKQKNRVKKRVNKLISEEVIAIPVLTANMALVLEYWVLEIGSRLPWMDTTAWSLIIFHVALIWFLYVNLKWDGIEESAQETAEDIIED